MESSPAEALAAEFDVDLETEESLEPEDPQRFRVRDKGAAAWAMGRLRDINLQMAENSEVASRKRQIIDRWLEQANSLLTRQAEFFKALLLEYHGEVLRADPKKRTVTLPDGTLKARKAQPDWVIDDEPALLEFLKRNAVTLVRTKYEVAKGDMKQAFTPNIEAGHAVDADGEIVPGLVIAAKGVEIAPGEYVTFAVTVKAADDGQA